MSIVRNASVISISNAAAQVIQMGALLVMARLAAPDAFGKYALFQGTCVLLGLIAGMRYENAIVIARSERQSKILSQLVILLGSAVCALLIPAGFVVLTVFCGQPLWTAALLTVCASAFVLFNCAFRVNTSLLSRRNWFSWLGVLQIANVASIVSCQVTLLLYCDDPASALIAGLALGQLASLLISVFGPKLLADAVWCRFGYIKLVAAAKHYQAFPRYMIAYSLSANLREYFVQAIVGFGAGVDALGRFSVSLRLASAPTMLLHSALGQALLSYARSHSRAEVSMVSLNLIRYSLFVLTPAYLFVAFNAEALSAILFGDKWTGMGTYLAILTVPSLAIASTAFMDRLFELYGYQRTALTLDLTYSVALFLLLASVAWFGEPMYLTIAFAAAALVYELIWTYKAFQVNGLGTQGLRMLFVVAVAQVVSWALICNLLSMLESVLLRAVAASAIVGVLIAVYLSTANGRSLLSALFRKSNGRAIPLPPL